MLKKLIKKLLAPIVREVIEEQQLQLQQEIGRALLECICDEECRNGM